MPHEAISFAVNVGHSNSEPTASSVEAAAAQYEQDDDNDQKRVGIHGSLLARKVIAILARGETFIMQNELSSSFQ